MTHASDPGTAENGTARRSTAADIGTADIGTADIGTGDSIAEDGAAGNGRSFDPRQAADLLDAATRRANRQFSAAMPALYLYRAVLALGVFGSIWLSVRGQHPYTGRPSAWALAVTAVLVAINIAWSTWAIRRSGTGVSGPAQRARQAWLGVMLLVWVVAYVITTPLYHAGATHPVWGLYPASAPLLIVGVAGLAVSLAVRRDRLMTGICLALAVIAAAAGFGGPAGSWLIMGIGLSAAMLAAAAITAGQQHRGLVRS